MALERTYHCDGPDCERQASTAAPPPHMPFFMLRVIEEHANGHDELHFCGWDCVLRFAGAKEPETVIPVLEGSVAPCVCGHGFLTHAERSGLCGAEDCQCEMFRSSL